MKLSPKFQHDRTIFELVMFLHVKKDNIENKYTISINFICDLGSYSMYSLH